MIYLNMISVNHVTYILPVRVAQTLMYSISQVLDIYVTDSIRMLDKL